MYRNEKNSGSSIDYLGCLSRSHRLAKYLMRARNTLLYRSNGTPLLRQKPFEEFELTKKEKEKINSSIDVLLTIIGNCSNERFGKDAYKQHEYFFNRAGERRTFFLHAFMSINQIRSNILARRNSKNLHSVHTIPLNALSHGLKLLEPERNRIIFNGLKLNIIDLYAAAVFYAVILSNQESAEDNFSEEKLETQIKKFCSGPTMPRKRNSYKKDLIKKTYLKICTDEKSRSRKARIRILVESMKSKGLKVDESDRTLYRFTKDLSN